MLFSKFDINSRSHDAIFILQHLVLLGASTSRATLCFTQLAFQVS